MPLRRDGFQVSRTLSLSECVLLWLRELYGLGVKEQSCLELAFHPCHLLCETLSHIFLGVSFLNHKMGNGSYSLLLKVNLRMG